MQKFIITYSKVKFYPLEPLNEDIKIEDIAHALSLMTRANGHCRHFYSVAQHSLNCYKEAKARGYSDRVQLGCLLHDASESYISDLTRPVKENLPEYAAIESKLQAMIYDRFGLGDLSEKELGQIDDIDDTLLYYEFEALMDYQVSMQPPHKSAAYAFHFEDYVKVEREYISVFQRLTGLKNKYCCVGIDGCKGKWIAVCLTEDGFEVEKYSYIGEICGHYPHADTMLIDIPIGLIESREELRPDHLVKKELGKKGSSIFETPCRQAIYSEDKHTAREHNIRVLGKSLSEQSLGMSKAIRQVDEFLQKNPGWKNKLVESHPELCFAKLNYNQPVLENKRTKEGEQMRLEVLQRFYPKARLVVDKYLTDVPYRKKTDDVIDALCLAVTGMIGYENGFQTIPENPKMDKSGLRMQMVCPII